MKHFTDNQLIEKYNEPRTSPTMKEEIEADFHRRHFGLVVTIAGEYPIDGMDRDDRAAECLPAMLKAVREFDPSKNMSVKNFIKLLTRRKLVDLYRSRNQVSEIPAHLLDGLDDPAGFDDAGTLSDMIADPSASVADTVQLRDEARDAVAKLAAASRFSLQEMMERAGAKGMRRLVASFLAFAEHRHETGELSVENLADIRELFADTENAPRLFALAPDPASPEAERLLLWVFQSYAGLQYGVLQGLAYGNAIPEIAANLGVAESLVSEILAAIKEVRSEVFGVEVDEEIDEVRAAA
jgi:hypothetical protein